MTDNVQVNKTYRQVIVTPYLTGGSGGGGGSITSPFTLSSNTIGEIPLSVVGFNGQTADLQQWRSSTGTILAKISAAGALTASNLPAGTIVTQTTGDTRYLQLSTATTKGDIFAATGAATVTRLAVGTTAQVLTVDSTTPTGLKWATISSGSFIGYRTVLGYTERQVINFTGSGVTVSDDVANSRTNVTITGGGGGGSSFYQTVLANAVSSTQRASINFVNSTGITFSATDQSGSNRTDITATPIFGSGAGEIAQGNHTHAYLTTTDANLLYDALGASSAAVLAHQARGADGNIQDQPHPQYLIGKAEDFAAATHIHGEDAGSSELIVNGDFSTAAGAGWAGASTFATVTYPNSTNINTTPGAQVSFTQVDGTKNFRQLAERFLPVEAGVIGLSGSFYAYSNKAAIYKVQILTHIDATIATLLPSTPGVITIDAGSFNSGTAVTQVFRWSIVLPSDVKVAKFNLLIIPDPDTTVSSGAPTNAQVDSIVMRWMTENNASFYSQAYGAATFRATNVSAPHVATFADPPALDVPLIRAREDRGGYHDAAGNRIVVPNGYEGLHLIDVNVPFAANGTGGRHAAILRNGVAIKRKTVPAIASPAGETTHVDLQWTGSLRNGDIITVRVQHNAGTGVNLNILSSQFYCNVWRLEHTNPLKNLTPTTVVPPVAGFTVAPTSGTVPFTVATTSTATGNIDSISYTWGDEV